MKVRTRIELFPTGVSGKVRGYRSGVRPNHKFAELDDYCIGQIDFEDIEYLAPGETCIAIVNFIDWPSMEPVIVRGKQWEIREGPRVVGLGTVIERINTPCDV